MYYHVTPTENVSRILREGLIPQRGPLAKQMEQGEGIYLFKTMGDVNNALSNWLGEAYEEDDVPLTLLGVELPSGIKTIPTTAAYEVVVTESIAPEYIQILSEDI
jgi:hypothetical protein